MNYIDYIDEGFRIMALQPVKNGKCQCGKDDCENQYKHPRASNWQHTPQWSDEQIENMERYGQLDQGFGVLVDDHIIIDVDPRNGGNESYSKLCKDTDIDYEKESGFVVETGGGGLHIYFKRPHESALVSHLHDYPGLDFKCSGFVVGAGSMHKSGLTYEPKKGSPEKVGPAPEALLTLLKKADTYRANYNGAMIDVAESEIIEMLTTVDSGADYDTWIKIGMAVHHATSGSGFDLWDRWSATAEEYPGPDTLQRHWHSFGKTLNPVTVGTLIHFAEEAGYQQPVTFDSGLTYELSEPPIVDLLRPPGFVGEITQWINSQCRFPRERLAVAAALSAISNIGGLLYEDEETGATSNQFIFCVAGSATGKEAVQQAQADIHRAVGFAPATHGAIKSEQEIVRNLMRHQPAFYLVDEIGFFLEKINNARQYGGASYLEGVLALLMSAYSKANSHMLLTGDARDEAGKELQRQIAKLQKDVDQGENRGEEIKTLTARLTSLDSGLERPFLSLIGYTTPVSFNKAVNGEQADNGWVGRALIFQEKDTNPKMKKGFKRKPMSEAMKNTLMAICTDGSVDVMSDRIENPRPRKTIPMAKDARDRCAEISDELWEYSEKSKETSLEAIPRRGYELMLKVVLTLGIPGGIQTLGHVEWAYALVMKDLYEKINLAAQNMASAERRPGEELSRRLLGLLDSKHPETTGVLVNRCRKFKKDDVIKTLEKLEEEKLAVSSEVNARNGTTKKWMLA